MENNALVKYQPASLTRVSKQIAFTNRILSICNDEKKIVEFFLEYPKIINNRYSVFSLSLNELMNNIKNEDLNNDEYIERRRDYLYRLLRWKGMVFEDFKQFSIEKLINFNIEGQENDKLDRSQYYNRLEFKLNTIDSIEENIEIIDWNLLSKNSNLTWNNELINKYLDKWNWNNLSCNKSIPWSNLLIEKYSEKWNWNKLFNTIPFTLETYRKYKNKLNLEALSLSDLNFLYQDKNLLNEFMKDFYNEYYNDNYFWINISENWYLPWTEELIEKYENYWFWGDKYSKGLSGNESIKWNDILIQKYINKIKWDDLLSNFFIHSSYDLIDKYIDKFTKNDWKKQSKDNKINWTEELIERFKDFWDWDELSNNTGIPITIELIYKYKDKWSFYNSNIYYFPPSIITLKLLKENINISILEHIFNDLDENILIIIKEKWLYKFDKLIELKENELWRDLYKLSSELIESYIVYLFFIKKNNLENEIPDEFINLLKFSYLYRGESNLHLKGDLNISIDAWENAYNLGSKEAYYLLNKYKRD